MRDLFQTYHKYWEEPVMVDCSLHADQLSLFRQPCPHILTWKYIGKCGHLEINWEMWAPGNILGNVGTWKYIGKCGHLEIHWEMWAAVPPHTHLEIHWEMWAPGKVEIHWEMWAPGNKLGNVGTWK